MSNSNYQIGLELGELRQRVKQLEDKQGSGKLPCRCHGKKRLTKQEVKKLQDWFAKVDAYRRAGEGETVEGLASVGAYTPAQIACVAALALTLCGAEVLLCGGPEDIPCIIAACGETWEEIVGACGL